MPTHTLARIVVHPFQDYEKGNILHVCELKDHHQGFYWIRNHLADDGVENDRTVRRGWSRWKEDEGHLGEREVYAYEVVRNAHPDQLRDFVGPKVVYVDFEKTHAGHGVELGAILDRRKRSPVCEGRLTLGAIISAQRGVNFGRDPSEVAAERLPSGTL